MANTPRKTVDIVIGLLILGFFALLIVAGVWRILTYPIHINSAFSLIVDLAVVALMIYGVWYAVRTFFKR